MGADHLGVAPEVDCQTCGAARADGSRCPRCLEPYERPVEPFDAAAAFGPRRVPVTPEYSHVRAGPTSFGFVGRCSLSFVPVVVAFVAVRNMMRSRHDLTFSYYFVIAVPTVVIVGLCLAAIWKRERIS